MPWILSTPYPAPAELGGRVRSVRERLGLSLRDLHIRTGVSAMTISRLENGHGDGMALGAVLRLCGGLETSASDLLRAGTVDSSDIGC